MVRRKGLIDMIFEQSKNKQKPEKHMKKKMREERICAICNKKFHSSWLRAKYCSYSCNLKANKLRYREKPNSITWFSLVEFINERDNYICQKCGSDKGLAVHHKKFLCNGGTNDIDNLITLCSNCHAKAHLEKV